jgi:hypothetical protein
MGETDRCLKGGALSFFPTQGILLVGPWKTPCVYSPPPEVEVSNHGRRCTFITIPTYVAPNYVPLLMTALK